MCPVSKTTAVAANYNTGADVGKALGVADPCNAIKCAVTCEAECGWSRPLQMCVAGMSTEPSEIEERLGDCPEDVSSDSVDTTSSSPSSSGGMGAGVIVAIVFCVVVLPMGLALGYLCWSRRGAGDGAEGTSGAAARVSNFVSNSNVTYFETDGEGTADAGGTPAATNDRLATNAVYDAGQGPEFGEQLATNTTNAMYSSLLNDADQGPEFGEQRQP